MLGLKDMVLAKILGGVAVALLIAVGVLYWMLGNANERVEELRNAVAGCEAARRVQNAAVERAGAEAEAQRQAYTEALESGNAAILEAQGRVRVVRQTAPNNCATPDEIMGAGL